ncbi:MAG TPA: MBL fold metallo-hydrolase [Chloroflexota bacterium]|nr:MBL fold metallo-hydrolase [Chloroflexota bacterium]
MSVPRIQSLSVGPMDNNVYILTCPDTGKRALIDPANEADAILDALGTPALDCILLTHGDTDHILALDEIRAASGAPVAIHPEDLPMLGGRTVDFPLQEGEDIHFGNVTLQVFHTPGHTAGGVCFYSAPYLIDGDTLFPGGPGNTQREGGDFPLIIEGIRNKLFTLPDDTVVYPGHGKSTTIGAERPHLQEWIDRGF